MVVNDEEKSKLISGVTKFEDDNNNLTDNTLRIVDEGKN